jgi:hypothetical protein
MNHGTKKVQAFNRSVVSLLEDPRAGTSQKDHLESYSCFLNIEYLRERNQHLFDDYESNVPCLKVTFWRSLLD